MNNKSGLSQMRSDMYKKFYEDVLANKYKWRVIDHYDGKVHEFYTSQDAYAYEIRWRESVQS